jgi:hypothetical protein
MTPLIQSNEYQPAIDHPMQIGWFNAGLDILDIPDDEPVPEQFLRFGDDARSIMHAVATASRRTDTERAVHERENVSKLLLSPEQHADYLALAGDPARVVEYFRWFDAAATDVYNRLKNPEHFKEYEQHINGIRKIGKIALELGGKRQVGDWGSTKRLDAMARSIPVHLQAEDEAIIEVFDDPSHPSQLSYTFKPLRPSEGRPSERLDYGIVRRRRRLADISMGGLLLIELFKDSAAVIILDRLLPDEHTTIVAPYLPGMVAEAELLARSREVAGTVFEHAIADKDLTQTVTPLSAQILMLVRAPREFAALLER